MFKKIFAIATVICVIPMMADAATKWQLGTRAMSQGGVINSRNMTGQTVANGSLFKQYTTATNSTVTAIPNAGFKISKITNNGVVSVPAGPNYTFTPDGTGPVTIQATFVRTSYSITATAGSGGTVDKTAYSVAYTGLQNPPKSFVFTPNPGQYVSGVTVAGTGAVSQNLNAITGLPITLPAAVGVKVKTVITTVGSANVTVAGAFGGTAAATPAVNPKNCQTCHDVQGVGAGVYSNWSSGSHGNKGTPCYLCHVGSNTGGHPGNIPASISLNTTGAPIVPNAQGFVTAAVCANCHKDSHDQWKDSWHTLKAKKGPALLSGSTENISPWALANWNTMKTYQILGRKANIASKNYVEMYVSVDKKQPQDVAVVIGQDRKQRYAVYYDGSAQQAKVVYSNNGGITFREKMIDDDNNPLTPLVWEEVAMPAQPDRAGYMFLWLEIKFDGGTTPAMNGNNYEEWRSWQERCIGCHTTGFDRVAYNNQMAAYKTAFAAAGNQPPVGIDMRELFISEWEISCENCHGTGAEHAQTGDKTKIISPAQLAKGDHVRREVCESCHTRTNNNLQTDIPTANRTANDRRGFLLGVNSYSDVMDYTSPAWGSGNRQVSIDGKGRRDHQMTMDIQLSKYIHEVVEGGFSYHGNQNCFDCHKSHAVGINKNGQNVWKDNLNAGQYGHSNLKSLDSDDGVRSTLRLKDTREALCYSCHVGPAPAGVLPVGVTAPQYATVTDLIKVFNAATPTYGYTFSTTAPVLDTALYATDPTAATNALTLVASNWATEGGRGARNSHVFNTDPAAATTNKAMGLKPAEYTWQIDTAKVGSTTAADYTAIWPWANAASGKTKVYGPLPTSPASKAPTTTRPWTP